MIKYVALIAATIMLSACAGTNDNTSAADRADIRNAEVRTGTRLPARDNTSVKTVSGQDYKQDANRTIGDSPKGQ